MQASGHSTGISAGELSLRDKLFRSDVLAEELIEARGDASLEPDFRDEVYAHLDGLRACYILDRLNGRCSIQASLNFDIADEEKKIDTFIQKCEGLLNG